MWIISPNSFYYRFGDVKRDVSLAHIQGFGKPFCEWQIYIIVGSEYNNETHWKALGWVINFWSVGHMSP